MAKGALSVIWTKRSQKQMRQIFDYISIDSPKNAAKVTDRITEALDKAILDHEIYPRDKYRADNDSTYRAFEIDHYRVSYRAEENVIRVLRVRHTSRKPQLY